MVDDDPDSPGYAVTIALVILVGALLQWVLRWGASG